MGRDRSADTLALLGRERHARQRQAQDRDGVRCVTCEGERRRHLQLSLGDLLTALGLESPRVRLAEGTERILLHTERPLGRLPVVGWDVVPERVCARCARRARRPQLRLRRPQALALHGGARARGRGGGDAGAGGRLVGRRGTCTGAACAHVTSAPLGQRAPASGHGRRRICSWRAVAKLAHPEARHPPQDLSARLGPPLGLRRRGRTA